MTETYAHNQVTSPTSAYNALDFAVTMAKTAMMTCTIVQVKKVSTNGAVAAIGNVEVQPLVQMVDGIGQTEDHVSVYNLPYVRILGGSSAVILDPKVNDIGIVVIADRDISGVKKSKKLSPPGSSRKYNISDGIFIGSVIADKPTSYVQFKQNSSGPDTIICGVGENNPCECVIAPDHVQMKKHGNSALHITVDVAGNQLIAGQAIVIGPDPYPND